MPKLSNDLFLPNKTAQAIFAEIENLPVIDIHTHVDLQMVVENETAPDPWTALCKNDHYVSALIETLGAMDRRTFFDPATPGFDKWAAYAKIFPMIIGNHVRDWMRITLAELGVELPFNPQNARAIWDQLTETLRQDRWRPVSLFKNSNIIQMSTTDNPTDSLEPHERAQGIFGTGYWRPTWRPDALFNLCPSPMAPRRWVEWVEELERATCRSIRGNWQSFLEALKERHDFFASHGCQASDYGFATWLRGHTVSEQRARAVFERASLSAEGIAAEDLQDFQSFMLRFSMDLDFARGWISQIHFGVARNQRDLAARWGGLDSGGDTIHGAGNLVLDLHDLLNHFDSETLRQHRILLYVISKGDWERVAGLSRIYPSVYAGMSWWYFDSVSGMLEFFRTMPDMGAGFRKMGPFVTDARPIYSLTPRTQVYRRCLSTALAELVDFRREPLDEVIALARYLCCDHAREVLEARG